MICHLSSVICHSASGRRLPPNGMTNDKSQMTDWRVRLIASHDPMPNCFPVVICQNGSSSGTPALICHLSFGLGPSAAAEWYDKSQIAD